MCSLPRSQELEDTAPGFSIMCVPHHRLAKFPTHTADRGLLDGVSPPRFENMGAATQIGMSDEELVSKHASEATGVATVIMSSCQQHTQITAPWQTRLCRPGKVRELSDSDGTVNIQDRA